MDAGHEHDRHVFPVGDELTRNRHADRLEFLVTRVRGDIGNHDVFLSDQGGFDALDA